MLRWFVIGTLIVCFAIAVCAIADYILEREEQCDKDKLIDEVIEEIERRNDNEY